MIEFFRRLFRRTQLATVSPAPAASKKGWIHLAKNLVNDEDAPAKSKYDYPIRPPRLMPGVAPADTDAPVMAKDSIAYDPSIIDAFRAAGAVGFPGYQYLATLTTRSEYRAMADALATELTREWIDIVSTAQDDGDQNEKISQLTAWLERHQIRNKFKELSMHDSFFGRAQLFVKLRGDLDARDCPLLLEAATIPKGSVEDLIPVESMWMTPSMYNAQDPGDKTFYRPIGWFMMGQKVHASRILTLVTRPLPDMLKPAFNFSGMSLSQLAEPYVDNWLRTRQSVSDLIANFSITALKTDMQQILMGSDGAGLMTRIKLFLANRTNQGLMTLDKNSEELQQLNTPLSGLHELQAQSQEQMCAVSHVPAVKLTGISPGGLNVSTDGEVRFFYDYTTACFNTYYLPILTTILKIAQLDLFGEIDDDIRVVFRPLYQPTPKEAAEIRVADSTTDANYVTIGAVGPAEVRKKIASDPKSGYQGLDTEITYVDPNNVPGEELQ